MRKTLLRIIRELSLLSFWWKNYRFLWNFFLAIFMGNPVLRLSEVLSHFANFTPCEELVPILHFWKMWNLRMVNFDNFGGLTSVLKFHIFLIFNCEELVCIRAICEGLVRLFLDVKNWYSIFTNVKNWYQFFTPVKKWYSIFTNVKNQYQMLTDVKNWYQFFTGVKNWYQIFTDVKN